MSSFKNRKRAQQLIDFEGLQWGKCKCTDIDLSLDWQQKTFVFVEIKGPSVPLTAGQKYHLEGLVKAIRKGGKTAHAILAHHNHEDPSEDIKASSCVVNRVYDGNTWDLVDTSWTLQEVLDELYGEHQKEYQ